MVRNSDVVVAVQGKDIEVSKFVIESDKVLEEALLVDWFVVLQHE